MQPLFLHMGATPIFGSIEGKSPSRHTQTEALHLAGALMEHFLEGSALFRLW